MNKAPSKKRDGLTVAFSPLTCYNSLMQRVKRFTYFGLPTNGLTIITQAK